jgi:hypothetical protein
MKRPGVLLTDYEARSEVRLAGRPCSKAEQPRSLPRSAQPASRRMFGQKNGVHSIAVEGVACRHEQARWSQIGCCQKEPSPGGSGEPQIDFPGSRSFFWLDFCITHLFRGVKGALRRCHLCLVLSLEPIAFSEWGMEGLADEVPHGFVELTRPHGPPPL